MAARSPLVATLAVIALAAALSCRTPTSISVEVRTDFACGDLHGTHVTFAALLGGDIDTKAETSTSNTCTNGYVGRVVVVPSGSDDEKVAIRVVAGFGKDVAQCAGPTPGKGCIVARRSLHYTPNTELHVPIMLRANCDGVVCNATQTCAKGACVDATLDPGKCTGSGCDESTLQPGATPSACTGKGGRPMVRIPAPTPFCIDTTETTNADYTEFLAAKGSDTNGQPPECAFNTSYVPRVTDGTTDVTTWPFKAGQESYPVVAVNWCDAFAYCAWRGKRLCGGIGGGAASSDTLGDPSVDEWTNACSGGGRTKYPWGDTFDVSVCDIATPVPNYQGATLEPVGSRASCQGGYAGVYDLIGSVEEWVNACNSDGCIVRGASVSDGDLSDSVCATSTHTGRLPLAALDIGIRCCADPL